MNDLTAVRDLMRSADPAVGTEVTPDDAVLARILARSAPPRTVVRPTRRPLRLVTVLVVGLLVAGAMLLRPGGSGSSTAYAATPPLLTLTTDRSVPAAAILRAVAAAAQRQPAPRRKGPYAYLRTENWYLDTAVAGGKVTSALESSQDESWHTQDGHGRARSVAGASLVDRVGSKQTLDAVLNRQSKDDIVYGQGDYGLEPLTKLGALPWTDAQRFADRVQNHTHTGIPVGVDVTEAVDTLFRQQPIPPAFRARIWRLLASVPGFTFRGTVRDRVGREGAAITLDDDGRAHGLPARYLLVVDRRTGDLLEYDDILTRDAGKLNVRIPAVTQLNVFLGSGWVTTTRSHP